MQTSQKKFNVIDVIIIFAIVVVIASPFLRSFIKDLTFSEKNALKTFVTLQVPEQDILLLKAISVGDTVYFEDTQKKCGSIQKISYTNNQSNNLCDFYITISCLSKNHDSGVYINDEVFIGNGSDLQLYTEKYSFKGSVIDIDFLD